MSKAGFRAGVSCFVIGGVIAGYLGLHSSSGSRQQVSVQGLNPAMRAPACGLPDDRQVHQPPDWISFVPPAKGKSYVDPVFGCTVTRLTESNNFGSLSNGRHPEFLHYNFTFVPAKSS